MVSILQTQRCKLGLRMLIRVRAVWDTDWTGPDTNDVVAANRARTEGSVVRARFTGSRWCRVGTGCQARGSGKAAPRRRPAASGLCCTGPGSTEDTREEKQIEKAARNVRLMFDIGDPKQSCLCYDVSFLAFKQQVGYFSRRRIRVHLFLAPDFELQRHVAT